MEWGSKDTVYTQQPWKWAANGRRHALSATPGWRSKALHTSDKWTQWCESSNVQWRSRHKYKVGWRRKSSTAELELKNTTQEWHIDARTRILCVVGGTQEQCKRTQRSLSSTIGGVLTYWMDAPLVGTQNPQYTKGKWAKGRTSLTVIL